MEIIDPEQKRQFEERKNLRTETGSDWRGRTIAGVIVISVGLIFLARQMGMYFPSWIFSWQMLVIAIGLFIGARESFRPGGWMIAVLVGVIFLIDRWIPGFNLRPYFWPIILILVGIVMIMSPGRNRGRFNSVWKGKNSPSSDSNEELLDTTSVFGGVKKNVISKNFRGGEVTCIFGGAEINMTQADIQGKVFLEVNQVFGGTKLIVPANWQIQSEATAIMGSVEDSRVGYKDMVEHDKILVIEGTSIFGGISIKSY